MNTYLKSAVQNLDCHIAQLTEMRNALVGFAGEPVPLPPVQTVEPSAAKAMEGRPAKGKQRTSKMQKRNGGGRKVKAEGRMQKEETKAGGTPALPGTGAFKPSTLAGAMKAEIGRRDSFTLEELQKVIHVKYGGEEFYTKAAANSFYGNLAYWAKTGRLEKDGDGATATFKVLDKDFFSQVEFQS